MLELNKIHQGDCLEVLKTLPDNSVSSIVTDPPYELGFMGKKWDNTGIAYNVELWKECLRVLKAGGHLLAFGGTRTYHRMTCAIEDAGFEIRDCIQWVYGSGFPKSLNVEKVLDKFLKTGNASWNGTGDSSNGALGYSKLQHQQGYRPEDYSNKHQNKTEITEEQAKQWNGWGTALKPANEPIVMARKPLAEKTVAENVLKYGTGGINIDGCRIGTKTETHSKSTESAKGSGIFGEYGEVKTEIKDYGRFPANFIHDGSDEVLELFPESNNKGHWSKTKTTGFGEFGNGKSEYLGVGEKDKIGGSTARFFYCAKASKSERNEGLEGFEEKIRNDGRDESLESGDMPQNRSNNPKKNFHPTVKPVKLMQYLVRLVTPKNGIVLDPFMGSGTTGIASVKEGFDFIGIEREEEYCKIAEARIKQHMGELISWENGK